MTADAFTVWVTGADAAAVRTVADRVAARLAGRELTVEVLDERTPGIDALAGDALPARAAFVAGVLARHGVATVIAVPAPRRADRDRARVALGRLIEVWVHHGGAPPAGYEAPERAEVEAALDAASPDDAAGRVLQTLEVLDYLPRTGDRAYSADEEREVIRRLKAFGYL
jgi:adenylylsulfate kinase